MNNLNSILIEGIIVCIDRDVKRDRTGNYKLSIQIECKRFYKEGDDFKEENSFFDAVLWSKKIESLLKLEQGQGIRLIGRLKQERWKDEKGHGHSQVYINCDYFEVKPNLTVMTV